jgi:hypothetical protein
MCAAVRAQVFHLESVRGVLYEFQGREKGGVGIVLVASRVVTEATGNEVRNGRVALEL